MLPEVPLSLCVWALTYRPQTLLISLTNWVKVVQSPHPPISSSMEIRACLWIWENRGLRAEGTLLEGKCGNREERIGGRKLRKWGETRAPLALIHLPPLLLVLPQGQLMWWVTLTICLPRRWQAQKIHILKIRGSNSPSGSIHLHTAQNKEWERCRPPWVSPAKDWHHVTSALCINRPHMYNGGGALIWWQWFVSRHRSGRES